MFDPSSVGFTGFFDMSLDSKGRVTTPIQFVKVFQSLYPAEENNVMVTVSPEKSVQVYPVSVWKKKMEDLKSRSDLDQSTRTLIRIFAANSFLLQLDNANRLRIPQPLLDRCGIKKEVMLAGQVDSYEVWDLQAWNEFADRSFETMAQAAQQVLDR